MMRKILLTTACAASALELSDARRFLLLLLRLDFDPKNEREPFEARGLKKTLPIPPFVRLGALLVVLL
jgi:hypothetical protein